MPVDFWDDAYPRHVGYQIRMIQISVWELDVELSECEFKRVEADSAGWESGKKRKKMRERAGASQLSLHTSNMRKSQS